MTAAKTMQAARKPATKPTPAETTAQPVKCRCGCGEQVTKVFRARTRRSLGFPAQGGCRGRQAYPGRGAGRGEVG